MFRIFSFVYMVVDKNAPKYDTLSQGVDTPWVNIEMLWKFILHTSQAPSALALEDLQEDSSTHLLHFADDTLLANHSDFCRASWSLPLMHPVQGDIEEVEGIRVQACGLPTSQCPVLWTLTPYCILMFLQTGVCRHLGTGVSLTSKKF